MPADPKVAKEVLRQEATFRKTIVAYIGGMLRSDVDPSIKVFTLVILTLLALISFLTLFLVLHICAKGAGLVAEISFTPYFGGFLGLASLTIAPGIPLMMRMSSAEQAARLEMGFSVIEKKKILRSRGAPIAGPPA